MTHKNYWLAFGDLHDDISSLPRIPELDGARGVVVTGDITFAGGTAQAGKALEPIAARAPALFAQIGNMDKAEVTDWLEQKGWNLHGRAREMFPGVYALGLGGSTATPFNTPSEFSEERLAAWLDQAHAEALRLHRESARTGPPLLALFSHSPPYASACDRLRSGAPAGSHAVRRFIETHSPAVCVCGHIHESRAQERIGATHVINPGQLRDGGYVLLQPGSAKGLMAELRLLS